MAHNDYVMPSGKWPSIAAPEKVRHLDLQIAKGINADDGGEWFPRTPIAIGGAGLSVQNAKFLGGIRTGRGYTTSSRPRIGVDSASDVTFESNRTRTVVIGFAPCGESVISGEMLRFDGNGNLVCSGETNFRIPIDQLRIHDGSTLSKIVFRWSLTTRPSVLPDDNLDEMFGIFRHIGNYSSVTPDTLHSSVSSSGAESTFYSLGYAAVDHASVESKWSGGRVKKIEYVPNQNNVIDTHAYLYQAQMILGYPAIFRSIELTFSEISTARFE